MDFVTIERARGRWEAWREDGSSVGYWDGHIDDFTRWLLAHGYGRIFLHPGDPVRPEARYALTPTAR